MAAVAVTAVCCGSCSSVVAVFVAPECNYLVHDFTVAVQCTAAVTAVWL